MEQREWPRTHDELQATPIQVRVASIDQIFNPMDPSPLEMRSLDLEVADWIEEWAEELDKDEPIVIEVLVADQQFSGREEAVASGIHHHFEYREWQVGRQLHKLMREGRVSLLIGLVAISVFSTAARLIGDNPSGMVAVLQEGLGVVGWVSMWKPLEIFLYEWWPIRRERRACRRLAAADVTFPTMPRRAGA